jgi:hypothetical protein
MLKFTVHVQAQLELSDRPSALLVVRPSNDPSHFVSPFASFMSTSLAGFCLQPPLLADHGPPGDAVEPDGRNHQDHSLRARM